jgi:hypothetical protein
VTRALEPGQVVHELFLRNARERRAFVRDLLEHDDDASELLAQLDDLAAEGGSGEPAGPPASPRYRLLSDLLGDPQMLQPPPCIIPRLAWQGRVTALAAPYKAGKTTLAAQAIAAKTTGQSFLGDAVASSAAVWVGIDESTPDTVQKLAHFGARDAIAMIERDPESSISIASLESVVRELGASVTVVDCLSEWVAGIIDNENDASQWVPHLRAFRDLATCTGCAVVLLHHANRGTGTIRGSSAIGAGVDAVIELKPVDGDLTVRKVESRGRMISEDFRIRYDLRGGFTLDTGELSVTAKVLATIVAEPGLSASRLASKAGLRKADVLIAIQQLLAAKTVTDRGEGGRHAFHAA